MFLGVRYHREVSEEGGNCVVRLQDGSVAVLSMTVKTGPAAPDSSKETPGSAWFERREAAARMPGDVVPGLAISGSYGCDPDAMKGLARRWGVDPSLAAALCWVSYLVGMELPGESALFSKVVLQFAGPAPVNGKMTYRASVESTNARFQQIRSKVALFGASGPILTGECWAFIRSAPPEVEEIDSKGVNPGSLSGRTAVIVGASRGLGAALKRALELRGAAVYSIARSEAAGSGPLAEAGDAADPEVLRRLEKRVVGERGCVDFLICNACPPVLPLRLEPNAAGRIADYIQRAVALTLTPLCTFLELLDRSGGCAVIVSSAAVEQPVREWPHYGAAKQAVEMLARVAQLQYPRVRTLVVRPQKLLTALTNTPMGRVGAGSPARLAERIAARLESPLPPGETEILL